MRRFHNDKLWREKDVVSAEGMGSIVHRQTLSDSEYDAALKKKLVEEAAEVQLALTRGDLINELADLYEIVDTLLKFHNLSEQSILAAQDQKKNKRGGFVNSNFVTTVEHPIGGYGESYCLDNPSKYPEITD